MSDSYLRPWLALSFMPGMSARIYNRLLEIFSTPENVLKSDYANLKAVGVKPALREALLNYRNSVKNIGIAQAIEDSLRWHDPDKKQHIISKQSTYYPYLLREISDPPPLLYVKGELEKLLMPQLAMVGSRNPGPVGRKNAGCFARDLCQAGYQICSGLALGIDSESHLGALQGGGSTLAILGTGVDQIYPHQNRALAQRIIENGALVSEFPLGTKPRPFHFPQRNRIISGMSQGTLVVEAALRSGSLITARMALEQGRELFAIPGSIQSATTRGCHSLIKQGAKLVENLEDILEELGAFTALLREKTDSSQCRMPSKCSDKMSREAKQVLAEIDYDVVSLDKLVVSMGMDAALMSVTLIELELKGLIQAVAGGYILSLQ